MTEQVNMSYAEIEVGTRASFRRKISDQDIDDFGRLCGDVSPLHTDNSYASCTMYGERLVHGMFLASLVSCLVGMHLPGSRSVCLSQSFDFVGPVYAGSIRMQCWQAMRWRRSAGPRGSPQSRPSGPAIGQLDWLEKRRSWAHIAGTWKNIARACLRSW